MRLLSLLTSLLLPLLSTAQSSSPESSTSTSTDNTIISIQPVSLTPPPPSTLAKIAYNPSTLTSTISSYYSPDLPDSSTSSPSLFKIGIFDPSTQSWKSSTSVTSSESFAKGYAPTFVVTLDEQGAVLGVSVKSARIDAGQTRDFGPKVLVRALGRGKGPVLNRPVVLTADGKVEGPVVEKTLLQKYWWVGLALVMVLAASGGD